MSTAIDYTTIPRASAPAPFPCDTRILSIWLVEHHGYLIPEGTRLTRSQGMGQGIIGMVQARYGKIIPTENINGIPYPSEVWNFVRDEEQRIRGGQRSLFAIEDDPAFPWTAPEKDVVTGRGEA